MRCVVPNCNHESSKTFEGITYHTFPMETSRRTKWLEALQMAGSDLQEHSAVCSRHFQAEDLLLTSSGLRTVRTGAVPIGDVKVCRICFASNCKLYSMTTYNKIWKAYETLTGLTILKHDNLPTRLCIDCAHQLQNYARFRSTSLRAHYTLVDIVRNYGYVTLELIQSFKVNSSLWKDDAVVNIKVENDPIECNNISDVGVTNDNTVYTSSLLKEDIVYEIKIENDATIHHNLRTAYVTNDNKECTFSAPEDDAINDIKVENDPVECNNLSDIDVTNDNTVCTSDLPEDDVEDIKIENYKFFNTVDGTNGNMVCTTGIVEGKAVDKSNKNHWAFNQNTSNQESAIDYMENEDVTEDEDYSSSEGPLTDAVLRAKRSISGVQDVTKVQKERVQGKVDTCRDPETDGGLLVNKTFSCDICPYKTNTKRFLYSHLKTHAANKSYVCNVCSFITIRRLSLFNHLKIHSGEKVYSCDVCNKTYKRKSELTKHVQIHSSEMLYSCDICNKRFNRRMYLTRHMRIHSGEKPFSCKVCNKAFLKKSNLIRHVRTHSGEKPFLCKICNKEFTQKGSLTIHLRTHSGEKPYLCNHCNKTFTQKYHLITHLRTHCGENL